MCKSSWVLTMNSSTTISPTASALQNPNFSNVEERVLTFSSKFVVKIKIAIENIQYFLNSINMTSVSREQWLDFKDIFRFGTQQLTSFQMLISLAMKLISLFVNFLKRENIKYLKIKINQLLC